MNWDELTVAAIIGGFLTVLWNNTYVAQWSFGIFLNSFFFGVAIVVISMFLAALVVAPIKRWKSK